MLAWSNYWFIDCQKLKVTDNLSFALENRPSVGRPRNFEYLRVYRFTIHFDLS